MPIMVGMMVYAVVVVCPAEDHNVDSHVESSYTRPSYLVSNNYRFSQTGLLIAVALVTAWFAAVEVSSPQLRGRWLPDLQLSGSE